MAVFKCKMCGGALEINGNETVAVCEYCGTKQTLPKLTDERKTNLYDRANHFRRNNEFDKAMSIYESILNEDKTDAESYWSLVLCKYGIEYVEDPANHKRIPTVNRAQYTSVFMDEDYKSAIEYADGFQKEVYESEAKAIDDIQKGILEISQKEEPFDVFICYKETDANGRRTQDSVLATELYHELCKEGFKVFFSRITLEDKLGTAYEPYIFAALNSAKVMVVLGTKQEHFNAVWVKNEWSRYLALIKNGARKTLIPAYKDMDPYDLPEEFSHLQAQDMTKLGFMQDLVRGIRKIAGEDEKPAVIRETVAASAPANTNTAPLLERAFMFLEDGDWQSADEYCEKVLDLEPKNAEAYLGKLMAELKVKKQIGLINCSQPFDNKANYQKVIRFADSALKEKLEKCIRAINKRNEIARLEGIYAQACEKMVQAKTERGFISVADEFSKISDFRDSAEMAKKCREKAEEAKITAQKDAVYNNACEILNRKVRISDENINYKKALADFRSLGDWRDSPRKAEECLKKMEQREQALAEEKARREAKAAERKAQLAQKEKKKAKLKKALIIGASALVGLIVIAVIISAVSKSAKYKDAVELAENGKYEEAIVLFEELGNYKDSEEQIELLKQKQKYNEAVAVLEKGDKAKAAMIFGEASGYKDARERSFALWDEAAVRETVSAGDFHTVGLKSDGTVVAVGDNEGGQCDIDGWTDIVAVSAGGNHTVGLKSDGTIVAVGDNDYGRCDVDGWTDIVAVSAGENHTVGLKSDGTVVAVGDNDYGQCNVDGWTDIVAVSAGYYHTVGLKSDGTVVAVGDNEDGQCGVDGWTDIVAVSAGWRHTVGLKSDGTVVAVGDNEDGQCDVGGWTDIVVVSASYDHTVGLKSDGTVVAVGDNEDGQCDVGGWTDIVAVSAGKLHTVGLKSDGTVVAVGYNYYGQCNVDGWTDIKLPDNK